MAIKHKKIFNFIIIAILMMVFFNLLSLMNISTTGIVYATEDSSEIETSEETITGLMPAIKKMVSQWYYIFRYFSIVAMLIVLIYLGIQMAITSVASDKAKYKRMLMDWFVGFIIIFCIHYFMVLILKVNEICLDTIRSVSNTSILKIAGDSGGEVNSQGLYETIRTRAYEFRTGIGTSGMIMYMVLVYYTIRFVIIYFKRFFTLMLLTIIAPLTGLSYAFTKVMTGKAPIITRWAQEYAFNVFLQTIHALIYVVFVAMALALSTQSIAGFVLALIMLNFMLKADKIFRKIFKFSGKLLDGNDNGDIKENMAALTSIKASAAALTSGALAKDVSASLKRGVGAVTNAGLYGGLSAYDKILNGNDKSLKEKEEQSKEYEKQIAAERNKEKKAELEKKKEKLDSKIASMQGRRNRLEKYKGNNVSKTALGNLANKNNIDRIANQRILQEQGTNGHLSAERKQQIRREVAKEYNNRIKRRNVEFNKRTGKYEVTSGIAKQLKGDLNRAIWGNNAIKGATKNMVKNTFTGLSGAAMIFAAVPQIVASPKLGVPLLAKGISNAKKLYGNNGYNQITTAGYRKKINKAQKKHRKVKRQEQKDKKQQYNQSKKYSFNRFNPASLDKIKAQLRMETESNIMSNIKAPRLGVKIFTMPLRFTGVLGAARNISAFAYQVDEARMERAQALETIFAIQKKDSLSKDFMSAYDRRMKGIEDRISEGLSRRIY